MKVEVTPRQLQILIGLVRRSTLDMNMRHFAATAPAEKSFYAETTAEFNELERLLTRPLGDSEGEADDDEDS